MDEKQLKAIMPHASAAKIKKFLPSLNILMLQFGINNPMRRAHFLAQIAHESGSLNYVKELASGQAYEGRADLGNTVKGYGVKYKGRGLIQITGFFNYKRFFNWLGGAPDILSHPELLEQPHLAVMVSCWFWRIHNLSELADRDDIEGITKVINGGLNGLAQRKEFLHAAKLVLLPQ